MEKERLTLASEWGKASIAVVISILVAAGFAALSYWLYISTETVREEIADMGMTAASLQQSLDEETRKYNRLFSDLLGYKDENAIMEEVTSLKGEKTLKNLISQMRTQQDETQKQIDELNNEISDLKSQLDQAIADKKAADEEHSKEIAGLRKQIDDLNNEMKSLIAQYGKKVADAQSETTAAKTKLDEREKAFGKEKAELKAKIAQLQKTIETQRTRIALLVKPAGETGPTSPTAPKALTGQINSDPKYGYATINLGKDSGVKRGMVFEIYQKKDGDYVVKAKFEVETAYREMSHGKIHGEEPENPVQMGDIVRQVVPGTAVITPEEDFGTPSP